MCVCADATDDVTVTVPPPLSVVSCAGSSVTMCMWANTVLVVKVCAVVASSVLAAIVTVWV